jgi:glycosyltransferase involved in cell wall biosynthesis
MEIIIIEDNSPDGTLAVAKTLTKIYNNIVVVL